MKNKYENNKKQESVNINDSEIPTNSKNNKKTATDNQWLSTGVLPFDDNRERRDGPGGEKIQ